MVEVKLKNEVLGSRLWAVIVFLDRLNEGMRGLKDAVYHKAHPCSQDRKRCARGEEKHQCMES